ncbi:phosphotransferase [Demequina subtropica]|uniref:phosphotransferase n=1 Tax=Demequina subtropica TaxID=1638989 RepID=UPI0007814A09|nr:phosphotransferase [Demequina subtropica]
MTWVEGEEIARGATAVVRRGTPGAVVKTFNPGIPSIVAHLEAAGSRVAMDAGLPVPAILDAAPDADPPTLTFAHVEGRSLAEQGEIIGPRGVGTVLAELQHRIRAVPAPALILPEEFLGFQVREADMPGTMREEALAGLDALSAADPRVLCHMDLHHLNVLWADGPVIIDWNNAMAAPAAADVARTRTLLAHAVFSAPESREELGHVLDAFIERTEELAPGLVDESRGWDRVIAAARLDENPPGAEREAILERWAA